MLASWFCAYIISAYLIVGRCGIVDVARDRYVGEIPSEVPVGLPVDIHIPHHIHICDDGGHFHYHFLCRQMQWRFDTRSKAPAAKGGYEAKCLCKSFYLIRHSEPPFLLR